MAVNNSVIERTRQGMLEKKSIKPNTIHIVASTSGVFFGLFSSINHGIFEILQGNIPTESVLIHAIGENQKFWVLGKEDAFTLIPNFLVTGILSIIVGVAIVIWSIWFLRSKHGSKVFLGLFVLSFLVGGGIGQVAFFLPAWAFSTRIEKPLTWWRKTLPVTIRRFLSKTWAYWLIAATIVMLFAVEIAVFGIIPGISEPKVIQNTTMILVLSAVILFVLAHISGIAHEIEKNQRPESGSN